MRNPIKIATTAAVVVLLVWGAPTTISIAFKLLTGSNEPVLDGFAATSSLFTGLALAGVIASLYLQQQQIARAVEMQRDTARLAALPVLLADLDHKIEEKSKERIRASSVRSDHNPAYPDYLERLKSESDKLFDERRNVIKLLQAAARLDEA